MTVRLVIWVGLLGASAIAQVNERELKHRYRITPDGTFILSPDVTFKAVFDQHDQACTLVLRGAISGDEVLHLFDVLVPANIRGRMKVEPFWCVNTCEHVIIYQNVSLATGAIASQTSDPAAIITFSRPNCKAAVAEAGKLVLHIKK